MKKSKRYVSLSNWIDKTDGTPKSGLAPISEGTSKLGNDYQITDTDNTEVVDGTYPVGSILESTTTFVASASAVASKAPATPPPAPKSTKA